MSRANILTINNLVKVYQTDSEKLTVLNGLNLNVEEGSKLTKISNGAFYGMEALDTVLYAI